MSQGIVISLGSITADFQMRIESRPEISETLLADDFVALGGGKGANVAYLARRLGVPATLLARVGDDTLKEQALTALREVGVELAHVRTVTGRSTGVSMITVPPDGRKGIILATNANDAWTEADLDEVCGVIQGAPAGSVLVVDYEVPPFIVEAAIGAAYEQGLPVILDPSPTERVEQRLFPKVAYVVPNAGEAEGVTGIAVGSDEDALKAARNLVERGVETAFVKRNEQGCVMANRQTALSIEPVPIEVVDTTGAGDAFAGALAVALIEQRSPVEAACFAFAASLLSMTRFGTQPAYPERDEVEEMARRLGQNVRQHRA